MASHCSNSSGSLKTKYSRDEKSSQMIDLIVDHARTDFLYTYGSSGRVGRLPEIFQSVYNKKSNVFTSEYEKRESSTLKALDKLKNSN